MYYFGGDVAGRGYMIDKYGDTITVIYLQPIFCFTKKTDMTKYWKTVRDFRIVYPLALVAKEKLAIWEKELLELPDRRSRREFTKRVEKELVDEYAPVMKHMTVNQGKILVRLIDRETEYTSYEVIREFRSGFVAGFWQGIARIFGHNLKDEYDPKERDRIIEQCIILYNAGLLPEY